MLKTILLGTITFAVCVAFLHFISYKVSYDDYTQNKDFAICASIAAIVVFFIELYAFLLI